MITKHENVRGLVQQIIDRFNRGKFGTRRAVATVRDEPNGTGTVVVEYGHGHQMWRYLLPTSPNDIFESIMALVEEPPLWKERFRRDFGTLE